MPHKLAQGYYEAVFDTDRRRALSLVNAALSEGTAPEAIIFEVVIPSLERLLSAMTTDSLITLSQHFLAAQIAEEVTDRLVPLFSQDPEVQGEVVLGTSFGDFHGLGKKIVTGCLKARMFRVTDLGLNVPAEKFVEEAVARNASVIGISSMMVHTAIGPEGPRKVRRLLQERGLEGRIKVIVGGAPYRFDPNLVDEVAADGFAQTAIEAPDAIAALIGGMKP